MKRILTAALLTVGFFYQPAQAADMSKLWTTIQDNAPRSVFDQLNDTAPVKAADGNDTIAGELAPVFDTLRDNAP